MESIDKEKARIAWIELKTFALINPTKTSFSAKDINDKIQQSVLTLDKYFMEEK